MAIRVRVLPRPVLFDADREPTAADDGETIGATISSVWKYDERLWLCISPARQRAVWLEFATFAPGVLNRVKEAVRR